MRSLSLVGSMVDVGGLEELAFIVVSIVSIVSAPGSLIEIVFFFETTTSSFASQIELASSMLMKVAATRLAGHLIERAAAAAARPLIWRLVVASRWRNRS